MNTILKLNGTGKIPLKLTSVLRSTAPFHPIDPRSLSGIQSCFLANERASLFQDSARTTAVTADGDPVGAWDDLQGRTNAATQATAAARPTYKTDGVRSWLSFDGGDFLQIAASTAQFNFLHDGTGGEIVFCFEVTSGAATTIIANNNDGASANIGTNQSLLYSAGFTASTLGTTGASTFSYYWYGTYGDISTGTSYVVASSYVDGSSPEVVFEVNQADSKDVEPITPVAPSTANATNNMTFGKRSTTNALYLTGKIYGVAFFNRRLTDIEREGVAAYMGMLGGLNV